MAQHVIHVQNHKVKYSNRNNSAADCSISLKFGTEFRHITGDTLTINVQGQRSKIKVTRSKVKLMHGVTKVSAVKMQ